MNRQELYLDRRLLKTNRALKDALLSLLKEKTFNEISVTNLVKVAKVTRASFYNHYSDKDDLLNSLLSEKNQALIRAYKAPILKKKSFIISKLTPPEVQLFDYIFNNADFYTTIFNSDIAPLAEKQMFESFKTFNIEGLKVKDHIIQSDFIASYLAYAIVGLISQWIREGYNYDPEFMSEQLLALMRISPNNTFHIKLNQKRR